MQCFVIMPFAAEFTDVYHVIKTTVESAVPGEEIRCLRLDEIGSAGRITEDLLRALNEAVVCVVDMTGAKPNVMWEMGYAMALNKPTITVAQHGTPLPFDVSDVRTIFYDRQSLSTSLRDKLAAAFRETLGRYEVRREARQLRTPLDRTFTIAVTGSMRVDPSRARRRFEQVLSPYFADSATWFCGSSGVADSTALKILAEHRQRVVIVGYHSFDISPDVLGLAERYKIPFVDARREQLPRGLEAPSERDLLFLTKADLLIALWDGTSAGTQELIRWYERRGRDHILAFA